MYKKLLIFNTYNLHATELMLCRQHRWPTVFVCLSGRGKDDQASELFDRKGQNCNRLFGFFSSLCFDVFLMHVLSLSKKRSELFLILLILYLLLAVQLLVYWLWRPSYLWSLLLILSFVLQLFVFWMPLMCTHLFSFGCYITHISIWNICTPCLDMP